MQILDRWDLPGFNSFDEPITVESGMKGEVKQDETGWNEAHLTIPVRGSYGNAIAHVVGGRGKGSWVSTTESPLIVRRIYSS